MRWMCATLLALASASTAGGQVLWAGLAAGTSWTWEAPTAPDQNFLHSSDGAPSAFVAFPFYDDSLVRLQVADLPFEPVIDGVGWPGKLRAYTVGVDYFFRGVFGEFVISGGLGSYDLRLKAKQPPADVEGQEFGWYLGVGEWFQLSKRWRVTAEVKMHRAENLGKPIVVAATAGLAFAF
jgi:hypothetical protein